MDSAMHTCMSFLCVYLEFSKVKLKKKNHEIQMLIDEIKIFPQTKQLLASGKFHLIMSSPF